MWQVMEYGLQLASYTMLISVDSGRRHVGPSVSPVNTSDASLDPAYINYAKQIKVSYNIECSDSQVLLLFAHHFIPGRYNKLLLSFP